MPEPEKPATDRPGAAPAPGPTRSSALDPAIAARLRRNPDGLVPAVVQEHGTGEVLMLAWMDDEALHRTLTTGGRRTGRAAGDEYWVKGETSGHDQHVKSVALDCDGDTLLVTRRADGPACHTGTRTCFFDELPVTARDGGRGVAMTTGAVTPDEATFRELARTRRVVPVTRRLLADGETPVGVYRKLAGGPGHVPAGVRRAGRRPAARLVALLLHRGAQRGHAGRAGRRRRSGSARRRRACRPRATRWRCCGTPSRR